MIFLFQTYTLAESSVNLTWHVLWCWGDSVPWDTAVDRSKKRAGSENVAADPLQTNVSVLILQQVSLFSNWWAAAEDKCSIGLAGRFVFSFAAANEPGPPKMADFGAAVVVPQAPLPTHSELLSWCGAATALDRGSLQIQMPFRL